MDKQLVQIIKDEMKATELMTAGEAKYYAEGIANAVVAAGYTRKWRRIAHLTAEAIKAITQKWYGDCGNTESDMQRLMLYETRLRQLLGKEFRI